MRRGLAIALLLAVSCSGTGDDDDDGPAPDFPADYAATYVEVRDCRSSGDHDLNYVRMLADPAALAPYQNRDAPFPVGSVVLKEEFDFTDTTCAGPIKQWTVMTRLADGTAPTALDWRWQRVDADRNVVGVDTPRCYGCHTGCGVPSEGGYEGTCAHP